MSAQAKSDLLPFTFTVVRPVEGLGLQVGQRVIVDPANAERPVVLVQDLDLDLRVVVALTDAGVLDDANRDQPLERLTALAEASARAQKAAPGRRFAFPRSPRARPSHLKLI